MISESGGTLLWGAATPRDHGTGDSYDNAMAESIIGLFKTEVIRRRGPWRNLATVEFATMEWVDWFNKAGKHFRVSVNSKDKRFSN